MGGHCFFVGAANQATNEFMKKIHHELRRPLINDKTQPPTNNMQEQWRRDRIRPTTRDDPNILGAIVLVEGKKG